MELPDQQEVREDDEVVRRKDKQDEEHGQLGDVLLFLGVGAAGVLGYQGEWLSVSCGIRGLVLGNHALTVSVRSLQEELALSTCRRRSTTGSQAIGLASARYKEQVDVCQGILAELLRQLEERINFVETSLVMVVRLLKVLHERAVLLKVQRRGRPKAPGAHRAGDHDRDVERLRDLGLLDELTELAEHEQRHDERDEEQQAQTEEGEDGERYGCHLFA